jgi:misacylated tRNA(Ala) deacylase
MRTHSGLHVLCGVVFRDFGALVTGGNMEPGEARMDFNLPEVPADFKARLEELVNAEVADRASTTGCCRGRGAGAARHHPDPVQPDPGRRGGDPHRRHIVGLDVQADGGTHVASTSRSAACRSSRW